MVSRLLNSGLKNWVSQTISKVFGGTGNFDLTFRDRPKSEMPDPTVLGYYNMNMSSFSGNVTNPYMYGNIILDLNKDDLPGMPQELIATVIMHESIHAYLATRGDTRDVILHHSAMAQSYRSTIIAGLKELFPSISDADANSLAWEGLFATYEFSIQRLRDMQSQLDPNTPTYKTIKTLLDYQNKQKGTASGCP